MPIADITYHSNRGVDVPVMGGGGWGPSGVLPPQLGNSQQLDFTAGAAGGAIQTEQVTAIVLSDTNCRIMVAVAADNAAVTAAGTIAATRRIVANIPEMISVPSGQRVIVRPL